MILNLELPTDIFRLNHGVHLSLVFSKLPISTSYESDFCFISKSSAEWNIVFIELEKPSSKFFNKNGTMAHDFNTGYSQIKNWQTHFSRLENQLAFKNIPVIKNIMSVNPKMYENPCNFKYILVTGRRNELENSKYYYKRNEYCNETTYVLTYDSLYENLKYKNDKYICRIKNNDLYIDSEEFIDDNVFAWTDCVNIKIKPKVYDKLIEISKKRPNYSDSNLDFLNFLGENTDIKLDNLKNNLIKKIE